MWKWLCATQKLRKAELEIEIQENRFKPPTEKSLYGS